MQQTVDAVAETKDQADVGLETILVFGLFCFFSSVAVTLAALVVVVVAAMTVACGLSFC